MEQENSLNYFSDSEQGMGYRQVKETPRQVHGSVYKPDREDKSTKQLVA